MRAIYAVPMKKKGLEIFFASITGVIIEVVGFFLPNSSIFDASKFDQLYFSQ